MGELLSAEDPPPLQALQQSKKTASRESRRSCTEELYACGGSFLLLWCPGRPGSRAGLFVAIPLEAHPQLEAALRPEEIAMKKIFALLFSLGLVAGTLTMFSCDNSGDDDDCLQESHDDDDDDDCGG